MELAELPAVIASRIVIHAESGCALWTGPVNRDGYGVCKYEGKSYLVHRLVPTLVGIEIPPRHVWGHLTPEVGGPCLFRNCCHPEHGRPVTVEINARELTPWNRKKTHCSNGHAYADHAAYYTGKDGYTRRYCVACGKGPKAKGDNRADA